MALHGFCDWLAATGPSLLIQTVLWVVPLVQTVHILLVAVVAATVLLLNLRLMGVGDTAQPIGETIRGIGFVVR